MVISIALVGIIASVAGMGIVTWVQGYMFTRENIDISQKAQLVTNRITREFMELSDIDSDNCTDVCIIYKIETESEYNRSIGLNNNNLELRISPDSNCDCDTPGHVLADRVGRFQLQYEDQAGSITSSPPADFSDLYAIIINFTLNRKDENPGNNFTFAINPRNNGNLNGPDPLS